MSESCDYWWNTGMFMAPVPTVYAVKHGKIRLLNPDCAVENVARFKNPKRNTKLEQF